MSEQLAALRNIGFSVGERVILHDISLELQRSHVLTVIGPNGAGKSTLVRILLGLQDGYSGQVERNSDVKIGYVPQRLRIDTQIPLTVERFLMLGNSQGSDAVPSVLEQVGAAAVLRQPLANISGGEFQRVLLARALLRKPDLLVLDEPTQGVDVTGQAQLYQLIESLVKAHDFGVLMVSHDLHVVMANSDKVLCLNQHICCSGHPEDVSRHPEYMRLFGDSTPEGIGIYTHHHDHQHDLAGNIAPIQQGGCGKEDCPHG